LKLDILFLLSSRWIGVRDIRSRSIAPALTLAASVATTAAVSAPFCSWTASRGGLLRVYQSDPASERDIGELGKDVVEIGSARI
jgi:hypothetical protein